MKVIYFNLLSLKNAMNQKIFSIKKDESLHFDGRKGFWSVHDAVQGATEKCYKAKLWACAVEHCISPRKKVKSMVRRVNGCD